MVWSVVYCVYAAIALGTVADAKSLERNRRDLEIQPVTETCALDRYRCDAKCIPLQWICDGYNDCVDKLDERNCIPASQNGTIDNLTARQLQDSGKVFDDKTSSTDCPAGKAFSCDKGSKCLEMTSLCDTVNDCSDGSDELNCPVQAKACESSRFSCDNGAKCLPLTWLCDTIDDCNDHRDEQNCPMKKQGISIAQAAQTAAVTAAREAKRAAIAAQELMKNAKQAAIKANKALNLVRSHS